MNDSQPISPQRRLQQLLAIPERQRTEEQWDELNELEISLTPVNREASRDSGVRRNVSAPHGQANSGAPSGQPRPSGEVRGRKPFKRTQRRPSKPNP